jgi:hypothetical protein
MPSWSAPYYSAKYYACALLFTLMLQIMHAICPYPPAAGRDAGRAKVRLLPPSLSSCSCG